MTEKIGRHKGAVETLLHEKKELSRILQIVDSQLQRHLKALEEEGIDTDRFIQQIKQGEGKEAGDHQEKTGSKNSARQEDSSGSGSGGNPRKKRETRQRQEADNTEELLEDEEGDFSDRDFSPR